MPFMMGTGKTAIKFSFSQAIGFLNDAILSIFQRNRGPDYLIGISFSVLPLFDKALVLFITFFVVGGTVSYLYKEYKSAGSTQNGESKTIALKKILGNCNISSLILLSILFFLCLAPAVSTIRLGQRRLTASFAVFIIMLAIVLSTINYKLVSTKDLVFSLLLFSFAKKANATYLNLGVKEHIHV